MEIIKAKENNLLVNIERCQVVGKMVVLAVNDSKENYIEVSIEEAKEKYNYQVIAEENENIER